MRRKILVLLFLLGLVLPVSAEQAYQRVEGYLFVGLGNASGAENTTGSITSATTSASGNLFFGSDANALISRLAGAQPRLQFVANQASTTGGLLQIFADGRVGFGAANRFQVVDQGLCTMAAGACSTQTFGSTYLQNPVCLGNWTGTGTLTGILKLNSGALSSVTITSSVGTDTAQIAWACFGN